MAWFFLFMAGTAEIAFAVSLKYNEGFTRLWPTLFTFSMGALSLFLLTMSLKALPLGTAYAVWTGMGAIGVALVSIVLFRESADVVRLLSIALVVTGIVGLKLTDG